MLLDHTHRWAYDGYCRKYQDYVYTCAFCDAFVTVREYDTESMKRPQDPRQHTVPAIAERAWLKKLNLQRDKGRGILRV